MLGLMTSSQVTYLSKILFCQRPMTSFLQWRHFWRHRRLKFYITHKFVFWYWT